MGGRSAARISRKIVSKGQEEACLLRGDLRGRPSYRSRSTNGPLLIRLSEQLLEGDDGAPDGRLFGDELGRDDPTLSDRLGEDGIVPKEATSLVVGSQFRNHVILFGDEDRFSLFREDDERGDVIFQGL